MSEVEKMYKNARINKKCIDKRYEKCIGVCYDCKYFIYPPFTAGKQIELIKWLARFDLRLEYTNAKYFMESHCHGYSVYIACFEEALAGFINTLWQDLTNQERTEIKRILED